MMALATVTHPPGLALPPTPATARLPRNHGIDLLRGIAIILVVVHHIGIRIPLKQSVLADYVPKWVISALMYSGNDAVLMFFVISGFLIANHVIARHGSLAAIALRPFYVRRAARILPCLLLLVAVLSGLHWAGVDGFVITRADQSLPGAIFAALGLYLNWYEGVTGYLPASWDVLWSLSIEELFYLVFPLLCLGLNSTKNQRSERLLFVALALLALSLPFTRAALEGNEIWQDKAYLPGMAGIAMGVCGAMIAARYQGSTRIVWALAVMGAMGIVATLGFGGKLWPMLGYSEGLILTTATLCLVLAMHWQAQSGAQWTFAGTAWLRSCGRLSYEIYLTHMFVVLPVVLIFKTYGGPLRWGVAWYLPILALCWLLGTVVAQWISGPSERALLKRFLR
jgi:peptidoglycan/LPS O-acetylase OafA/YrhL